MQYKSLSKIQVPESQNIKRLTIYFDKIVRKEKYPHLLFLTVRLFSNPYSNPCYMVSKVQLDIVKRDISNQNTQISHILKKIRIFKLI